MSGRHNQNKRGRYEDDQEDRRREGRGGGGGYDSSRERRDNDNRGNYNQNRREDHRSSGGERERNYRDDDRNYQNSNDYDYNSRGGNGHGNNQGFWRGRHSQNRGYQQYQQQPQHYSGEGWDRNGRGSYQQNNYYQQQQQQMQMQFDHQYRGYQERGPESFGPPQLIDRSGSRGGRDNRNNNYGGQQQYNDDYRRGNNSNEGYQNQNRGISFNIDNKPDKKENSAEIPKMGHFDFYNNVVLGASVEDTIKFHGRFMYREPPPSGIDKEGNLVDEKSEKSKAYNSKGKNRQHKKFKSNDSDVVDLSSDSEEEDQYIPFVPNSSQVQSNNCSLNEKDSTMDIHDKIEYYNREVRKDPLNIQLWIDFAQFQDKYFEDSIDPSSKDQKSTKKFKKRGNRKALVEKKISILEKAIESNPKSLDLHVLRLDLVYELYKPKYVLTEWKKLVTTYSNISAFWIEYIRFAATQLQIYSSTSLSEIFSKCFEKFQLMLNPNYPDFQRPDKFPLLLADFQYGVSVLLKNSGYMEKAIALQQAQLEMNFFCPNELKTKDQSELYKSFESFWSTEEPRVGEPNSIGWRETENKDDCGDEKSDPANLSDDKITEYEDLFFEELMAKTDQEKESLKINSWLAIESMRGKLCWTSWRSTSSELDQDSVDSNRIVSSSEITPYLIKLPENAKYLTDFERNSAYFRNIVNFLLLLQEDFLPRTHTLEASLPAFSSISIVEGRTLFSEFYYWKKLLDLYHKGDPKIADIFPKGYQLSAFHSQIPTSEHEDDTFVKKYSNNMEEKRVTILRENYLKNRDMIRKIVETSLNNLDKKFSILLCQLLFRFEQRCTYEMSPNDHKSTLKFVKNLIQHENLRNASELYGQISLIEYYGGRHDKAIDLIAKTINSSCHVLTDTIKSGDENSSNELDLNIHWEMVAEITILYRTLAEFLLQERPEDSKKVLISLGKSFKPVQISTNDDSKEKEKNDGKDILRARRFFEKVLEQLLPTHDGDLIRWGGETCIEYFTLKPNLLVEWTTAFALFQLLTTNDFEMCEKVFETVFEAVKITEPLNKSTIFNADVVNRHHIQEQLHISLCKIGAYSLGKDLLQNSKFRTILVNALMEYPSSPPLLIIFTDVENQCSIAGRLWRVMINEVKQEKSASSHWSPLFMGLALARKIEEIDRDTEIGNEEFGIGGPSVPPDTIYYKLDSLLSASEQKPNLRNCPLIWRIHLKHLALRVKEGKDEEIAKSTFYEAIRHCPSVKALYMDGISYFPEMTKEIIDIMNEKQILIRLPMEELEVLMEKEEEMDQDKNKKKDNISSKKAKKKSEVQVIISKSPEESENSDNCGGENEIEENRDISDGEI